jgi:hypothetical protein
MGDETKAREPNDSEPTPERQAELQAARAANLAAGQPPYADVRLVSRGELTWVMRTHGWSGDFDAYTVKYELKPRGQSHAPADLRGVNLSHLVLRDVMLRLADLSGANLVFADLSGAHLTDARCVGADMGSVNLSGGELNFADLSQAHLREANLSGANLQYANLSGARLPSADLTHTQMRGARMDSATILSEAHLDAGTWLGDVIWSNVSLARIEWDQVPRLGDEAAVRRAKTAQERLAAYRAVARAYQQLSLALRSQGLNEYADRYAYRAQVWQRRVFRARRSWGRWLLQSLLGVLAGYGFRLWRILAAYIIALVCFASVYFIVGLPNTQGASTPSLVGDAFLVSLTAIHGRVFFEQLGLGSALSWVAAIESVVGIVIEGVFTAMLVQRFFGGR